MEKLTSKEYWENSWNGIPLPAGYLNDYSHGIIAEKIIDILKKDNIKIESMIELGGCPGRWSDFFNTHFYCKCDIIDYGENNCRITEKNYKLLGIKGEIFNKDVFSVEKEMKHYDVVISDGLIEHFTELEPIFKKHLDFLNKKGILIIGVPNIKQSCFYDYFARKDYESYKGYRIVNKEDLIKEARKYNVEIKFCDYLGVVNFGLIHWNFIRIKFIKRSFDYLMQFLNSFLLVTKIKKETKLFSPYIFLICKNNE